VADRITTSLGDVHRLAFPSDHFAMVLAMGVIPWLPEPEAAIREMARVVEPGGYVLASTDNLWRLHSLFNASKTHFFGPFRWGGPSAAARHGARRRNHAASSPFSAPCRSAFPFRRPKEDQVITLGFGPFSFFGHDCFETPLGSSFHQEI